MSISWNQSAETCLDSVSITWPGDTSEYSSSAGDAMPPQSPSAKHPRSQWQADNPVDPKLRHHIGGGGRTWCWRWRGDLPIEHRNTEKVFGRRYAPAFHSCFDKTSILSYSQWRWGVLMRQKLAARIASWRRQASSWQRRPAPLGGVFPIIRLCDEIVQLFGDSAKFLRE